MDGQIIIVGKEDLRQIVKEVFAEMGVPAHREQTSPKFLDMDKLLEFFRQNNCHISKSQIYKLTRTNKIPCRKIGKSLLFSKDEVTEWLENGKP